MSAELATITDPAKRLSARSALKEEALTFRRQARRYHSGSKLADSVAKFGGGSLLTATLLLIVGGQARASVIATAALTLLLFVAGTALIAYLDTQATNWDFSADWVEALLEETER